MSEDTHVIRGINWRETFPFTNIFRSFRVAIHPSKLILALLALFLIYLGGRLMDGATPMKYRGLPNEIDFYERMRATPASAAELGDRAPMRSAAAREPVAEIDFKTRREQERESIQRHYAQELQELKIESDGKPLTADEATAAAKRGGYLNEAHAKI